MRLYQPVDQRDIFRLRHFCGPGFRGRCHLPQGAAQEERMSEVGEPGSLTLLARVRDHLLLWLRGPVATAKVRITPSRPIMRASFRAVNGIANTALALSVTKKACAFMPDISPPAGSAISKSAKPAHAVAGAQSHGRSLAEHEIVVDMIRAGDPEGAAPALRDHVIVQGGRFHDLIVALRRAR